MYNDEAAEKIAIQKLLVGYEEQKRHLRITNDQLKNEIQRLEDAVRKIIAQRELAATNKAAFYMEVKQLLDELENNSRQLAEMTSKGVKLKENPMANKHNQGTYTRRQTRS